MAHESSDIYRKVNLKSSKQQSEQSLCNTYGSGSQEDKPDCLFSKPVQQPVVLKKKKKDLAELCTKH